MPVFGGMNTPDDVPRCATRWIAVAVDAESGTVLGGGSGGSLAAALDRP